MASRLKSRQGSLISDECGSFEPGTAVAYVLSSGAPLAVLCSFERKGLWFNTGAARAGESTSVVVASPLVAPSVGVRV